MEHQYIIRYIMADGEFLSMRTKSVAHLQSWSDSNTRPGSVEVAGVGRPMFIITSV